MTNLEIPPCGPERDRLVAEAVGWEFFTLGGKSWCSIGVTGRAMLPSQSDADALAALEAWRTVPDTIRSYVLSTPNIIEPEWRLSLGTDFDEWTRASAPTLCDAATAALVRWRNERSEV